MTARYFPGPWVVGPPFDGFVYGEIGGRNIEIASVCGYMEAHGYDRRHTVKLIAAAPMLLEGAVDTVEALRLLVAGLKDSAPETLPMIQAHISELEHAISAARGAA